jgi:small nuclear ribonucleoprotein D3
VIFADFRIFPRAAVQIPATIACLHSESPHPNQPPVEADQAMATIGIPIKLLHESQGHIITVELTNGQVYRGKLLEAEDNCNAQLKDVTMTARDGRVSHLENVYIRGSHVRFFVVPEMLRNAPMFRNNRALRARGAAAAGRARGRGRA